MSSAGSEIPEAEAPQVAVLPAPADGSLQRRAVRGTVYSLLNVGGAQVLRLAGNLITSRLLAPDAFGLLFSVMVLNQGLQMISDVGILPSIIQHKRGDERAFLDTAWTIQVVRGVVISGITLALAWPWAQLYGEAELFPLVLVASLQGTITGLDSTKLATLNRRMQVGRLLSINLAQAVVTQAVMIGYAYLTRSAWALLFGAIAGEIARMVLSHLAVPGPNNRFHLEKEAAKVIFSFGKWIFVSTLVTFLGLRFDGLVLPLFVDRETLGVYSIGQSLAALPVLVTGQVVIWVLLPALSESFREDRARFTDNVLRARRVINVAGVFMVAGTAAAAPSFFYVLYDDRYIDAGWMVQLLMVSTWFFFLQETSVRVQLAMGDSRLQMISNLVKLAVTAPAVLVGYWLGGLPYLILGLTFGAFAGYVIVAWNLRTQNIPVFATDLKWTLVGIALALGGGLTPWLIAPYTGVDPHLLSIPIAIVVIAPYGLYAARVVRREMRSR
jgi:O-antigen/teichoic acid export membrane protein